MKFLRLAEKRVMDMEGRAQGAPAVAGRRLDEEILEGRLVEDPAVGHGIEGHASGHAELRQARPPVQDPGPA